MLYVTTSSGIVAAYDAHGCGAATCEPVWSVNAGQPVRVSPVPVRGRLLVAAADGTVTAYRPAVSPG